MKDGKWKMVWACYFRDKVGTTNAAKGAMKKMQNMNTRITFALVFSAMLVIGSAPVGLGSKCPAPAQQRDSKKSEPRYYCVMDPEVKSNKPGTCPKCGMTLRLATNEAPPDSGADNKNNDADAIKDYAKPGAIPDTPIYDQDGKKLLFYSDLVKGKTVAINFIFTTCTTICPPLAATFRRIQVELGSRVGNDILLISISVDPTTDVPERLKAFAAKFKAGPGWTFVTGRKPDIDLLLKALGASVSDKTDHTPMVLVGNESAGYWTRSYGLAPPAILVKVITDAASKSTPRTTALGEQASLPAHSR